MVTFSYDDIHKCMVITRSLTASGRDCGSVLASSLAVLLRYCSSDVNEFYQPPTLSTCVQIFSARTSGTAAPIMPLYQIYSGRSLWVSSIQTGGPLSLLLGGWCYYGVLCVTSPPQSLPQKPILKAKEEGTFPGSPQKHTTLAPTVNRQAARVRKQT